MSDKQVKKVKARVLVDCTHGKIGQVVMVDENIAASSSELDSDPAAVRYAEANAPKKEDDAAAVTE